MENKPYVWEDEDLSEEEINESLNGNYDDMFYRKHPLLNIIPSIARNIKFEVKDAFLIWYESKFRINKIFRCDKCGMLIYPLKGELLSDDYGWVVNRKGTTCHHCDAHIGDTWTEKEWAEIVQKNNKEVIEKIIKNENL